MAVVVAEKILNHRINTEVLQYVQPTNYLFMILLFRTTLDWGCAISD